MGQYFKAHGHIMEIVAWICAMGITLERLHQEIPDFLQIFFAKYYQASSLVG